MVKTPQDLGYTGAILIDVDDVHPESGCGLETETGPLATLKQLHDTFGVSVTLFTTADWTYKPQRFYQIHRLQKMLNAKPRSLKAWPEGTFKLDHFREWCGRLNGLGMEIGFHGLNHIQNSYPFGAEFQNLGAEETGRRLDLMEQIFSESGLRFTKVFRPPGWGVTQHTLEALEKRGFFISASVDSIRPLDSEGVAAGLETAEKMQLHEVSGVFNVTANADILRSDFKRVDSILQKGGVVLLHGHIEDRYHGENIGNGVTERSKKNLESILSQVKKKYGSSVWYPTFSGLYSKLL